MILVPLYKSAWGMTLLKTYQFEIIMRFKKKSLEMYLQ